MMTMLGLPLLIGGVLLVGALIAMAFRKND